MIPVTKRSREKNSKENQKYPCRKIEEVRSRTGPLGVNRHFDNGAVGEGTRFNMSLECKLVSCGLNAFVLETASTRSDSRMFLCKYFSFLLGCHLALRHSQWTFQIFCSTYRSSASGRKGTSGQREDGRGVGAPIEPFRRSVRWRGRPVCAMSLVYFSATHCKAFGRTTVCSAERRARYVFGLPDWSVVVGR